MRPDESTKENKTLMLAKTAVANRMRGTRQSEFRSGRIGIGSSYLGVPAN